MGSLEAWKQSTLTRKSHKSTGQYDLSPGTLSNVRHDFHILDVLTPIYETVDVGVVGPTL